MEAISAKDKETCVSVSFFVERRASERSAVSARRAVSGPSRSKVSADSANRARVFFAGPETYTSASDAYAAHAPRTCRCTAGEA